jgi:hypothetical protein
MPGAHADLAARLVASGGAARRALPRSPANSGRPAALAVVAGRAGPAALTPEIAVHLRCSARRRHFVEPRMARAPTDASDVPPAFRARADTIARLHTIIDFDAARASLAPASRTWPTTRRSTWPGRVDLRPTMR